MSGWGAPNRSGRGRRRAQARGAGENAEPLTGPAGEEQARAIALRRLTRAPQSRVELERAIAGRGVASEPAAAVLDGLERVGLIDDAAYAAMIVRTRHTERGLARPAIGMELRRRGIDRDTAAEALAQLDDEDEQRRAEELARRHLAKNARLEPAVRARRAYGHLARKGYSAATAGRAVRRADTALVNDDILS